MINRTFTLQEVLQFHPNWNGSTLTLMDLTQMGSGIEILPKTLNFSGGFGRLFSWVNFY